MADPRDTAGLSPDVSESFYRHHARRYSEVSHEFRQSVYTDASHSGLHNDWDLLERAKSLAPGKRCLDAGCGAGARDVYALWQAGYNVVMDYAYQHSFGHIWNDFDHEGHQDHVFAYPALDSVIDTLAWEGFREAADDARRYIPAVQRTIDKARAAEGSRDDAEAESSDDSKR